MNILITGGAGFVGSQLGHYLQERDHTIYLYDNMSYGHKDNLTINKKPIGVLIEGDVRESLTDILKEKKIEAVIHLAGIAPLPDCQMDPYNAYDNNVGGTLNVLECCRLVGIKKIVFASTSAIYENCKITPFIEERIEKVPNLVYSSSKLHCEMLCDSFVDNYGMDIVCLRLFNVYGPHQDFKRKHPPLMGYIIKSLLTNTPPTFYSDGEQKRDYIHVTDLARCFELVLLKNGISGEKFNVCSGDTKSVKEIYAI